MDGCGICVSMIVVVGVYKKLLIFPVSLLLAGSPGFATDHGSQAEVVCDRNCISALA